MLKGQTSGWRKKNSGVRQGTVLGRLFSKVINTVNSENTLYVDLKSISN